jgi:quercetin dioxygenase-like cupin family protein
MFKIREAPATHITSEILVERVGMRVIRMELPAGEALPSHYAARDVALICVRGCGRVNVNRRVVPVDVGAVVGLLPGELHGVYADSALGVIVIQAPHEATQHFEGAALPPWLFHGT